MTVITGLITNNLQPPPTAYITYSYGNGEGHTSLNRTIRALAVALGHLPPALLIAAM